MAHDSCSTSGCSCCSCDHDHDHTEDSGVLLKRVIVALVIFFAVEIASVTGLLESWFGENTLYAEFVLFLIPFLIAGYDVVIGAFKSLLKGHALDENFLMTVASLGAFGLIFFPDSEPHMAEGAAVMIFFQVGELFQSYAVNKSRKSIADMMDIAPEYATIMVEGKLQNVDPFELAPEDEFIVMPGDRVPLDGMVVSGTSQVDTSALTGESVPRTVNPGEEVISGCVNLSGKLVIKATKPYQESTVNRILKLVENAAEKKARTENFITRFARVYTPTVVGLAAFIAIVPPLVLGQGFSDWIMRGLTFLVVSCPCALVISVPLSFFGGIGGASRKGILVKGSNYLEALAHLDTVVFDKTGTLTTGTFEVVEVNPVAALNASPLTNAESEGEKALAADTETDSAHAEAISAAHFAATTPEAALLLEMAAHAEAYSTHPIATSVKVAYGTEPDTARINKVEEISGQGVKAEVDEKTVLVGNKKLMDAFEIPFIAPQTIGTVLYVAVDGAFLGSIVIADRVKPHAAEAIQDLYKVGVHNTVMLTGDRTAVAQAVAHDLDIKTVHAELLPQGKVEEVEKLLADLHGEDEVKGHDTCCSDEYEHEHADACCSDEHKHEAEHVPSDACCTSSAHTHKHAHEHEHKHAHEHEHEHTHEQTHEHNHNHEDDCCCCGDSHASSNADTSQSLIAPHFTLAFVGDGINDAPVLTRADVGIAMGALGSDAAIEAADVVLMDDDPRSIARAVMIARKTMRIVKQNIVFALGIKFAVLILAAFGIANMWMAVFADVGVAVLAILNATRAMR